MSTVTHTRRLVEHRYGRPLEDLRRDAARSRSDDPVLPVVLRRLDALTRTGEQTRAARRSLHAAWQDARADGYTRDDRLRPCIAELLDLERQEQSHAEAVWDLLDIRLLLEQPGAGPSSRRTGPASEDADLMDAAREAADLLPRLTRDALRPALHDYGIHISNRRLGLLLQQLRAERTR
ncbi:MULTISPECIES: hypothetical protein [unclassified Streptomyces]|uniref:hypothetical protein n=1 Tax=unclassified Streptomyces TaxID=2593676 RepID=UPI002E2836C4|nr:hypothetical protein [Streptomyces sp. NBC_00223]